MNLYIDVITIHNNLKKIQYTANNYKIDNKS